LYSKINDLNTTTLINPLLIITSCEKLSFMAINLREAFTRGKIETTGPLLAFCLLSLSIEDL